MEKIVAFIGLYMLAISDVALKTATCLIVGVWVLRQMGFAI